MGKCIVNADLISKNYYCTVYKPEAQVDNLACRLIRNVSEIARQSIENFEIHVQNNQFELLQFHLGYRTFYINSPEG